MALILILITILKTPHLFTLIIIIIKKESLNLGQALDIETLDDTWFIYLQTKNDVITKIHLAVEELYDYTLKRRNCKITCFS